MRRVSRYLILIGAAGALVVGFWLYDRYFKPSGTEPLRVVAMRGDMQVLVRSRGEVLPDSEYSLEFGTGGIVSRVYVSEGDTVAAGQALMTLDTSEAVLQRNQLQSLTAEREAELAKLEAGGSVNDIQLALSKVSSAKNALASASSAELLAIRTLSSVADSAVHGTTDGFYRASSSATPSLVFSVSDSQLQITLESERAAISNSLVRIASSASTTDIASSASVAQLAAANVGVFLDNNFIALHQAIAGTGASAGNIELWQSAVESARGALDSARSVLSTADDKRMAAQSALDIAETELESVQSPARAEDLSAARAALAQAEGQAAVVDEQIRKATLTAPEAGKIVKVNYHAGESFKVGAPAIVLYVMPPKLVSDISELDISQIAPGETARIEFDALPGKTFSGEVVSIDPQKLTKDGDTYYRVNISLSGQTGEVRTGMNADINILIREKKNVLKIPEYMTYERDGQSYVRVDRDGVSVEVPVALGASDGESREVLSGLAEGETVVVPAQ